MSVSLPILHVLVQWHFSSGGFLGRRRLWQPPVLTQLPLGQVFALHTNAGWTLVCMKMHCVQVCLQHMENKLNDCFKCGVRNIQSIRGLTGVEVLRTMAKSLLVLQQLAVSKHLQIKWWQRFLPLANHVSQRGFAKWLVTGGREVAV